VLSADAKTKRIALSMKTPGAAGTQYGQRKPPLSPPKPPPTLDDKLAALADRWKKR
jgi:uncharacterized protein